MICFPEAKLAPKKLYLKTGMNLLDLPAPYTTATKAAKTESFLFLKKNKAGTWD